MTTGTYVYCLVANRTRPRVRRALESLPKAGPVRLIQVEKGQWLVVSDVPLDAYGEAALKEGLSDLDWVADAALAHEHVVEAFLGADAVLPMKLFTIFANDARAAEHISRTRAMVDGLIARVSRREEWGVRVALERAVPVAQPAGPHRARAIPASGSSYLLQKKSQRDAVVHRARRARAVAAELYDALARHASEARRRPATETAAGGRVLVLDAAFLVPRSASPKLKAAAARHARALTPEGYAVSLTGPWPPYSFMQE